MSIVLRARVEARRRGGAVAGPSNAVAGVATHALAALALAILGALGACSTAPLERSTAPPAPPPPVDGASARPTAPPAERSIGHARSRWLPVRWDELPGWSSDRTSELWPALLRGCARPAPGWAAVCAEALGAALPAFSDDAARAWLEARLQPYRVEALDSKPDGLATGYFEPLVEAVRQPTAAQRVPIYGPPADLAGRQPYWTRQQIDTLPAARAALRGRTIAFLADPLDALVLQIQGSGRLDLTEPDGRRQQVRVAFAAHNGHPYRSVGRWLIEQGELVPAQASWPGIKAWARAHPERVDELLWVNPRTVFFREEPLSDPTLGPRGAQGVPLTPGRSIAVDPLSIPFGTPVWLDTTEPLGSAPLRRLVMAQDTGTAITGAVRADYFWGWGADAEAQAGRMKQPLRIWVLWPRG